MQQDGSSAPTHSPAVDLRKRVDLRRRRPRVDLRKPAVDLRKRRAAPPAAPGRHRRSHVPRRFASRVAVLVLVAATAGSAAALPGSADPPGRASGQDRTSSADGGGSGPSAYSVPPLTSGGKSTSPSSTDLARQLAAGSGGITVALSGDDLSIPPTVLAAYKKAAATVDGQRPGCHLTWPVLAGIGKIESNHGRHGGSERIGSDGTISPAILGPRLAGGDGVARIVDTDHGRLDGDTALDRAVGPMQFIPSTWATAGRDGNGDGRADPENVYDATLSAAGYLCADGRDLATTSGLVAALRSYNPSDAYAKAVLAWAAGYASANQALLEKAAAGTLPAGPSGSRQVPITETTAPPEATVPAAPRPTPHPASPTPTHRPTTPPTAHTPGRTPTPSPTGRTPASPTPTPTCTAPTVRTPAVTAEDSDGDHVLDRVDVDSSVTVPAAATYKITVTLRDTDGYPVSSLVTTKHLAAGTSRVALALPGADVGDAGARGTYHASVQVSGTAACTKAGTGTVAVTTIDPSRFAGWTTTLDRLRTRLTGFRAAGDVTGTAAAQLTVQIPAALTDTDATSRLTAFRTRLTALGRDTGVVDGYAAARLDSIAGRLITQIPPPASSPTPTATPSATPPATPPASTSPTPSATGAGAVTPGNTATRSG